MKKVKSKWKSSEHTSYSSFGEYEKSSPTLGNLYELNSINGKETMHSLFADEIPVICSPFLCPSIPIESLHAFLSLQFADENGQTKEFSIDILIALDAYWKFMVPINSFRGEGLVA